MAYLLIFQPLYNILTLLTFLFRGNVGWAIFILAVLLRLALFPLNRKTMLEQNKLIKIQPKMKEIHKKYKQEPSQANKEIMELYRQEKVNPFGALGGVIIQVVLFIFLFIFFNQAIKSPDWTPHLYSFIKITPILNYTFLGFINLQLPNFLLVVISALMNSVLTFLQPAAANQNKMMFLLLPFITLFYWKLFPAAIIVYWIATSLVGIIEPIITRKVLKTQSQKQI
ncbi:MAG: YidC/Oxa1 family membrane protein insertase [Candidatus Paceibacterota bacterium]|jgi:YidC/Oxa1 family membrane protein insertase